MNDALPATGFRLVPGVLDGATCDRLRELIPSGQACIRDVLAKQPQLATLLRTSPLAGLLGQRRIVRSVFFSKPLQANWQVPWHQDALVQLDRRTDDPAFSQWSDKEGVVHAKPPLAIMQDMLSLRIHLTPCGPDDGPLKLIPGSHRAGYLNGGSVTATRAQDEQVITAKQGDVLLFAPLLLHASCKTRSANTRAILHLEASSDELDWWYTS